MQRDPPWILDQQVDNEENTPVGQVMWILYHDCVC